MQGANMLWKTQIRKTVKIGLKVNIGFSLKKLQGKIVFLTKLKSSGIISIWDFHNNHASEILTSKIVMKLMSWLQNMKTYFFTSSETVDSC